MDVIENRRISYIRVYLFLSALLSLYSFYVFLPPAYGIGNIFGFSGRLLVKMLPLFLGLAGALVLIWLSFTRRRSLLLRFAEIIRARLPQQRITNTILCVLPLAVYFPVYFSQWADTLNKYLPYWWSFGHLLFIGSIFLHAAWRKQNILTSLVTTGLGYFTAYEAVIYGLGVSTYPLSMGWSEASRYYYASLFASRRLYGTSIPLPTFDTSRALLQAIPFLIPALPLWFHRLWQALIWLVITWVGSASVVRRFKPSAHWLGWLLTAWGFLFFFQGPVYYQLFLAAIIILWGFDRTHPRRTMLLVLIASAWAGLSRFNWFPVPGLLAVFLYLLETPLTGKSWNYWIAPTAWSVGGLLAAFAAQQAYIMISNNPPAEFLSSLSSPLLWNRLWPNSTYSTGIILGLAAAILPVAIILFMKFIPCIRAWHPLRSLVLAAILGVFMTGGIVVSIKIGGGSNLHNLDAFLIFLVLACGYLTFERYTPDWPNKMKPVKTAWTWFALAALIPMVAVLGQEPDFYQLSSDYVNELSSLQTVIDQAQQKDGEVLFITQRHLVTFGMLHGVRFDPNYEKVVLMEMAMADNRSYLNAFEDNLAAHRYALVIFERLTGGLQTRENAFSEENNAWYTRVTLPVLKYYQLKEDYPALSISVLEPNSK